MDINEAFAISNKPGEITLTGFHFINYREEWPFIRWLLGHRIMEH